MRYPVLSTLLALVVVALCSLPGCTNEEKAQRTLDDYGFTNIKVGGWSPMACGDDYLYSNEFTATNAQGRRVSGTVCCGVFKGCTVKF